MSNYVITPALDCWEDWKRLAGKAKISFTPEDLDLGEMLIGNSEFPPPLTYVVSVGQSQRPISLTGMLYAPLLLHGVPLHPVILMTLALGMRWDLVHDERVVQHMPHPTLISPFLLAHDDGRDFLFVLGRDEVGLHGTFKDLHAENSVPRHMEAWGYPHNTGWENHYLFECGRDGTYGRQSTTRRFA